ncbi:MAG TPA: YcxB family protein, partial [Usitatibacter sp.]|nr:YcxB family protein [Usitatibacter sp.]
MRDLYSYSLSPEQFAAAVTRNGHRILQRMHTGGFVQILNGLCLGALAALAGDAITDGRLLAPAGIPAWAAGVFAAGCIALSLFARHSGVQLALRRSTFGPGPWKLGVDDDGIWWQGPHGESFTRWSGWRAAEERDGLVLLYNDDVHVQAVPFAAFESAQERRAFIDHVRERIAAQPEVRVEGARPRHVVPGTEGEREQVPPTFAPSFRTLLHAAVRIAAFQPVAPNQLYVTWVQVVGMVLVTLVPPALFAAASIGEAGHVAWQLLPSVLFHVPVILVAAIMLAHFIGRAQSVVPILAGTLLAWAVIDFVTLALWAVITQTVPYDYTLSLALYYGPLAWLALAVMRLALSFIPRPGPRMGWVFVTCLLFLALPLATIQR